MPNLATDIIIDPDFRDAIPPIGDAERAKLEENLIADGCREPLVVWHGERILLDGHNRYEICTRLGLDYDVHSMDFADREAAADWIDSNQLGRRNLTPDQMKLLRGRRYNRAKKNVGVPNGNENAKKQLDQNEPIVSVSTAERLAAEHGVSAATIKRDGQFADSIESLKVAVPDIEQQVMAGNAPSRAAVNEAANILGKDFATAPVEEQQRRLNEVDPLLEKHREKKERKPASSAGADDGEDLGNSFTVPERPAAPVKRQSISIASVGIAERLIDEIFETTRKPFSQISTIDLRNKIAELRDVIHTIAPAK